MMIAADAKLLVPAATRQLLCGIAASTGEKITVLPIVAEEVERWLPRYYIGRWLGRSSHEEAETLPNVAKLKARVKEWLSIALSDPQSPFQAAEGVSMEEEARFLAELPDEAFARSSAGSTDALFVAQALDVGADVVLTGWPRTIDEDVLNLWHAQRSKGDRKWVFGGKEVLHVMCDSHENAVQHAIFTMLVGSFERDMGTEQYHLRRFQCDINRYAPGWSHAVAEATVAAGSTDGFETFYKQAWLRSRVKPWSAYRWFEEWLRGDFEQREAVERRESAA